MLILKHYISKMPKLQTVILPVGYPTLFFELGYSPESWRQTHYTRDFGFPISLDQFKFKFFILSKMLKWNLEDIETHFLKKEKVYKMTDLGWGTDYGGNREGKIEKSAKASIFWHTAPKSSYLEVNKKYLEEIIQICAEKDIKLILFNPPLHNVYRERRDPGQVAISFNFVEDMLNRYPNLVMLDFSEGEGFDEGDFYDGDHMNEVGAKKLSQKLNNLF